MAEDISVDDIITKFLLNTTRLHPRLTQHAALAAIHCGRLATQHPSNDEEADAIPLTTGSVAEFYIEPMHECFGDIDVMYHDNNTLAIPRGHSPPTQLPDEFHNYVKVFEIIDSQFPGYVYLEVRYLLTQCSDDDTYNAVEYDRGNYVRHHMSSSIHTNSNTGLVTKQHGPAQQYSQQGNISVDAVLCVRCLLWPMQAADWSTWHRNYEWPDSATVDRVVSNGCDLVQVAHPMCRQHELHSNYQWRLSFSRAEIVLINSWMPLQQIVYHLLRVFLKTERLTESADNSGSGTLSNYHIKTLMLWACELKPRSWWTDNFSFTAICADLLHILSLWLYQGYCPHYFITGCNLFDHCDRAKQIFAAERLSAIDQNKLIDWFLHRYLPECCQRCPRNVSLMFVNVNTNEKLQRALSAVADWRRSTVLVESWNAFEAATMNLLHLISKKSITARLYPASAKELTKFDANLPSYMISVHCLHIACNVSNHGFTDKWKQLLKILCDASDIGINFLNMMNKPTSEIVDLLQKSAIDSLTAFRQLEARDFGSVVTIVTTDFEAMYAFKRGDYQHCLQFSAQNVRTLLYAHVMTAVPLLPEFLQLLDDDIVSLTALTLIVNPLCRYIHRRYSSITQLTLLLYLMTQCQLKLRHPVTSLAQTLDCIELAQSRHPHDRTLNQLTLKLAERKILTRISEC